MTDLQPSPQHHFSFGLPTRHGPDVPRDSTRLLIEPWDFIHGLAEIGAWGVAVHDDELVPPTATSQERQSLLGKVQAALDNTGVVVSMFATDLSRHPAFADGAFTATDGDVRRCAIQKSLRAIDLGAELRAPIHVLSGAHEGSAATAIAMPTDTLDRYREAIDFLCGYVRDNDYPITFALVPCNGDTFLPTIGHALGFIETLDQPDLVNVGLRASEPMTGQGIDRGVAQTIRAGRLVHIDLMAVQDSARLKDAFFLVKVIEESDFAGPRHFSTRPYQGEYTCGVWDFAAGCMRTYLALAAKARRFADDPEIQEALADAGALDLAEPTVGPYRKQDAKRLAGGTCDPDALAGSGYHHERLDQLITDLLLGLR